MTDRVERGKERREDIFYNQSRGIFGCRDMRRQYDRRNAVSADELYKFIIDRFNHDMELYENDMRWLKKQGAQMIIDFMEKKK